MQEVNWRKVQLEKGGDGSYNISFENQSKLFTIKDEINYEDDDMFEFGISDDERNDNSNEIEKYDDTPKDIVKPSDVILSDNNMNKTQLVSTENMNNDEEDIEALLDIAWIEGYLRFIFISYSISVLFFLLTFVICCFF